MLDDLETFVVTPALKDWARGHFDAGENLPDGAARRLVKAALQRGELTADKFADLLVQGQGEFDERNEAKAVLTQIVYESLKNLGAGADRSVYGDVDEF